MQLNSVEIAGEVRCVVTKANGAIKIDTGYQKNLILNQGLEFFGGNYGAAINSSCAIGSGNNIPTVTQTTLDALIAISTGTDTTSSYAYTNTGDGMYRLWEQKKYRFTGLNNVNVSEVGLVSMGTTSANYHLTTRALIKDSLGAPTSISVKTGETLDIYYKIHEVIDTRDKSFAINVLDGNGGIVPYNVIVRPAYVGSANFFRGANTAFSNVEPDYVSASELATITSGPNIVPTNNSLTNRLSAYVNSSYKRTYTLDAGLSIGNIPIRTILISTSFGRFQVRLGRISDDAPLTKTNKETLSIPLEFSWGRYEGAL